MFTFHRPKVYRSTEGCCICKAKSSSSRFTVSKKYEDDCIKCFQLSAPRHGEICNACVLLVKRWKKLPADSNRHWKHVVDARVGPGTKSMTKFKCKIKRIMQSANCVSGCGAKKKIRRNYEAYSIANGVGGGGSGKFFREYSPSSDWGGGDLMDADCICEDRSNGSSRINSPHLGDGNSGSNSDIESDKFTSSSSGKTVRTVKNRCHILLANMPAMSDFLDMDYWQPEEICCGIIFRGLFGEMAVDGRFLKAGCCAPDNAPCMLGRRRQQQSTETSDCKNSVVQEEGTEIVQNGAHIIGKAFSDSSSDSGYDDSSNPAAITDSSKKVVLLNSSDENKSTTDKEELLPENCS